MLPIIDLHCHYLSGQPGALEDFRRLVASPEVGRVAVCALDLGLAPSADFPFMSLFRTTNEELARFIDQVASPKLVPWCFIDPRAPDAPKQVDYWIRRRGMRGLKLYPPMGWYPDEPRVLPTFQAAAEARVPVLVHMGRVAAHPQLRSKYARPVCLEAVGLACPDLKVLIGHFGSPWQLEAAHIAMGFPHFYFDLATSGHSDLPLLRKVVENPDLGLRRIVLGTDGVGSDNLARTREIVACLRAGGFTDPEIDAITHRNGLEVLGEAPAR